MLLSSVPALDKVITAISIRSFFDGIYHHTIITLVAQHIAAHNALSAFFVALRTVRTHITVHTVHGAPHGRRLRWAGNGLLHGTVATAG